MEEKGISVIDLVGFTKTLTGEIFIDHVHFGEEVFEVCLNDAMHIYRAQNLIPLIINYKLWFVRDI